MVLRRWALTLLSRLGDVPKQIRGAASPSDNEEHQKANEEGVKSSHAPLSSSFLMQLPGRDSNLRPIG